MADIFDDDGFVKTRSFLYLDFMKLFALYICFCNEYFVLSYGNLFLYRKDDFNFFQFKPLEEKVHYYRNVDNALYAHLCYRCDYLVSMPVNFM